jgi:hypothetical protein
MNTRQTLAAVLCVVLGLAPGAAQGLTGSWKIVAEPGINTCPGTAERAAYDWLVTEDAGEVRVVVQGQTAYPQLTGKLNGRTLLLEGEGEGRMMTTAYPSAVFVLSVGDRAMTGTRYVMHLKPAKHGGATTCLVTYTVTGKMM